MEKMSGTTLENSIINIDIDQNSQIYEQLYLSLINNDSPQEVTAEEIGLVSRVSLIFFFFFTFLFTLSCLKLNSIFYFTFL